MRHKYLPRVWTIVLGLAVGLGVGAGLACSDSTAPATTICCESRGTVVGSVLTLPGPGRHTVTVAGWIGGADGRQRAALWRNGVATVLAMPDSFSSTATRVNATGDVRLEISAYPVAPSAASRSSATTWVAHPLAPGRHTIAVRVTNDSGRVGAACVLARSIPGTTALTIDQLLAQGTLQEGDGLAMNRQGTMLVGLDAAGAALYVWRRSDRRTVRVRPATGAWTIRDVHGVNATGAVVAQAIDAPTGRAAALLLTPGASAFSAARG